MTVEEISSVTAHEIGNIKYKGYDIDVMGINTDASIYIYTLKDEL